MSVLFSDNFNRADGGLGSNWTNLDAGFTIASNVVAPTDAGCSAYYNGGTPAADCWVEIKIPTLPTSTDLVGVGTRLNVSTFNGYYVEYGPTNGTRIRRIDAGVATTLASLGSSPSAGQVLRLEIRGSTFSVYIDDVLAGTTTDSNHSAANPSAILTSGTSGRLDDFATGNLPTISSATPSGTLGTSTTATIGCTTDDSSGTLYVVVDTASLSGITEDQIKAGQNASSVAADAAGNSAVSGSSPSVGVTGLSASTAYNYAILQFSGGNSNILTGTFTTAAGGGGGSSAPVLITGGKIISFNGKLLRFG